jgi:thiamine pyrophosphate-dependent acetolactate synthase large subunit-like protein
MMEDTDVLKLLGAHRKDEVVITTMSANYDWTQVNKTDDRYVPVSGAMGKASGIGLGIALAQPNTKVWVFDGDGSLLMNLGALITIATSAPKNLIHFVCENDAYDTTGGQPVPGAGKVDFAAMARAAGYPRAFTFENLEDLQNRVEEVLSGQGPTLAVLKVASHGRRPSAGSRPTPQALATLKANFANA